MHSIGVISFSRVLNSFTAVQNERDRISCRRQSTDDPDPGNGLAVQSLLKAEMESRQSKAGAVLENTAVCDDLANKQLASINDVCESMKQQLLILVEWAKHIPAFNDLQLDDQVRAPKTQEKYATSTIAA